ncbi:MAG TPA: AAA family ATPase [Nonomuraea sp.]|nr:AAA family ATPase [Nonomuraea sp.]
MAGSDGAARSWVLAACEADHAAYDGRFTQAVVNVLRSIADGNLDIDPALPYIPLTTVAREIRQELARLSADGFRQTLTASLIDLSADVNVDFFPNPRYDGNQRALLRRNLDATLIPFFDDLDEGLDVRHFLDRAGGVRLTDNMAGCFTGRKSEIMRLSSWLNGWAEGSLAVVTGGPGSGKSAVLGVLVCAAHPVLREPTKPIWIRCAAPPHLIQDAFAAVHARQRTVQEVAASLARQLGLSAEGSNGLLDVLPSLPGRAVIVIDGLDEALDAPRLVNDLILPLARSGYARLLIGARNYTEYSQLFQQAHEDGFIIDLDAISADVLEDDLHRYISDLLRATPEYRSRHGVLGEFAGRAAFRLAQNRPAGEVRKGGEFLIAGLYARHVVRAHTGSPIDDLIRAKDLGESIPCELSEVLELDLALRENQHWLRPVLMTLAHARGQGMPESLLTRLVSIFTAEHDVPTALEMRQALEESRFYIRQTVDVDGVLLYRLYHQGLADHLRVQASVAMGDINAALFTELLAPLGAPGECDWAAAEPYILRHGLEHAADAGRIRDLLDDPEFLLHAPAAAVAVHLHAWDRSAEAEALTGSAGQFLTVRQSALALACLRTRDSTGAELIATLPSRPSLRWQPIWIFQRPKPGSRLVSASPIGDPLEMQAGPVYAVAIAELYGQPVVVTGSKDSTLRIWDMASGNLLSERRAKADAITSVAVTVVDGELLALCGYHAGPPLIWNLTDETVAGVELAHNGGSTHTVSIAQTDGRTLAVVGEGRLLRTWELGSNRLLGELTCSEIGFASATVALAEEPAVVVAGGGNAAQIWDLATQSLVREILISRTGWTRAVAIADRGTTLVAAGDDGVISVTDLATGQSRCSPIAGHEGHIYGLSVSRLADRDVILSGGQDRTARLWDLATGTAIGKPIAGHRHWIRATAIAQLGNDHVAVTGSDDATARIWALEDGRRGYVDVFQRDGEWYVATNSSDGMVAINIASGERQDLALSRVPPASLAFQASGDETRSLHVGDPILYQQGTPDGYLVVATEREIIAYRAR